jgi:predicted DsbA family dithiol-disulfide isomerase
VWLQRVKAERAKRGERLDVTWRHFLLDQVNSKEGPGWKLWEQPEERQGKTMVAQRAGEAARRQEQDVFERFHLALLIARHGGEGRIALDDVKALTELARRAGLDVERFTRDLADHSVLDIIARDHMEAAEKHGVFGTPTFLFESGLTVYLKMFVPPPEDTLQLFEHFTALMAERSYLGELKRPQPPWPKGAVKPASPGRK